MFVEIEKEEGTDEFAVDKFINEARGDGFSLEEAMEVLKKTNYYGIIKKVIKEINKYKTAEERLAFKEFVLSAVDGRETSPEAFDGLYKLAVDGGYVAEFLHAFSQPKVYKLRDGNILLKIFYVAENANLGDYDYSDLDKGIFDFENKKKNFCVDSLCILPKVSIFKNFWDLELKSLNLKSVEDLNFDNVETLVLDGCKNVPQSLNTRGCKNIHILDVDVSKCENIVVGLGGTFEADNRSILPETMDLSQAREILLEFCDLSNWDGWNIKSGTYINLRNCRKLPKVLDLSGFDKVNLCEADLSGVEKVIFKEGAEVNMSCAKNLNCEINLDAPASINLMYCDLTKQKKLNFRDGAKVNLESAEFDVSKIDFSVFSKIELNNIDFSVIKELKFRKGASVSIISAKNFPKVLDFSQVKVDALKRCDFSGVEELKFGSGDKIILDNCCGFSKTLDLSGYDSIQLGCCELSSIDELKLKDNAKVVFERFAGGFPKILDLSKASGVEFKSCVLSNIDEIKFKEGASCDMSYTRIDIRDFDTSNLSYLNVMACDFSKVKELKARENSRFILFAKEYPKVMDVSRCSYVRMGNDVEKMHRVIFKNRKQRDGSMRMRRFTYKENEIKYRLLRRAKFRYVEGRLETLIKDKKQQRMQQEKEM